MASMSSFSVHIKATPFQSLAPEAVPFVGALLLLPFADGAVAAAAEEYRNRDRCFNFDANEFHRGRVSKERATTPSVASSRHQAARRFPFHEVLG